MIIALRYIAAVFGCALTLSLSNFARADVLADTCLDYVNSSEMFKEAPASNRSKWCGCIVDKITPRERQSVAEVIKLQKATEAKGQAFGEPSVPKPLANAFTLYFDALGPCLPIMMGAAPGQTAPAPPAAAPPAAAPPAAATTGSSTSFGLANATGSAISELYVSPTKSKTWGKDILGDHTIEDGEVWKITVPKAKGRCMQDLKVVFDDNSEAIWESLDLCDLTKITLTYDRRSGVTTAKTE